MPLLDLEPAAARIAACRADPEAVQPRSRLVDIDELTEVDEPHNHKWNSKFERIFS